MGYIRTHLLEKFEFHSYGHALEILEAAFPGEWAELQDALERFTISLDEIRITGDLVVNMYPRRSSQRGRFAQDPCERMVIEGYIDGHNIDFIKGRVAFDLEWNSKDQTFDRDLLAMRTYFDCGIIEVGVIVTRSQELNDVFREVTDRSGKPLMAKYGASTTWMGKLEYRLKSRRNGGCPILAVGIRQPCIEGY